MLFSDIAKELNMSREEVIFTYESAIKKLRKKVKTKLLEDAHFFLEEEPYVDTDLMSQILEGVEIAEAAYEHT